MEDKIDVQNWQNFNIYQNER